MALGQRQRLQLGLGMTLALLVLVVFNLSSKYSLHTVSFRAFNAIASPKSKNAFCVFLAEPNEAIKEGEEDYYYMGTRMLIYQLLHDPETKTNTSIPFIVLVTAEVPQSKRDQLTHDGATVLQVEEIQFDWIKPGRPRWKHVMDKLHVFELIQFEKILLLDSDIVVTKRLDNLFDEVEANVLPNLGDPSKVRDDEAPQPFQYLMAGNSGPSKIDHPYPSPRGDRLNAGFVLFKPSLEIYQYYMSVAAIEGRFPGGSPEQDLWNYAHRRDGNMPWIQINPDWTVNTPIYNDYEHGVATFHEKYWGCARDRKLRDVLLKSRWKMEGFFNSYDL
jgi:alpha-N-acetylglucosamine transferase